MTRTDNIGSDSLHGKVGWRLESATVDTAEQAFSSGSRRPHASREPSPRCNQQHG